MRIFIYAGIKKRRTCLPGIFFTFILLRPIKFKKRKREGETAKSNNFR